jgi:hypothetical protein
MLANIYVIIFFVYIILGYNFIAQLMDNKKIDFVNLNPNSHAFLLRRLIKLSFIAIILSILFFMNPTLSNYISVSIVNVSIIVCFYLKWGIKEPVNYFLHILTTLPVLFYPCFANLIIKPINCSPFITVTFLIFYSFIQDLIYKK